MGKTLPETRPWVAWKAYLPFLINSRLIIDHFAWLWQPSWLPKRIPPLAFPFTFDPRQWGLFVP